MDEPIFQLRFYTPEDHATIQQWCESHGHAGMPHEVLPRLGVICEINGEDSAAMWLYMDNSCGVCFAEYAVTRPKLQMKQAREALLCILNFLKDEASANNYTLMAVHTVPAIARILKTAGFHQRRDESLVSLWGLTKGEA